jgi:hypothetical protein
MDSLATKHIFILFGIWLLKYFDLIMLKSNYKHWKQCTKSKKMKWLFIVGTESNFSFKMFQSKVIRRRLPKNGGQGLDFFQTNGVKKVLKRKHQVKTFKLGKICKFWSKVNFKTSKNSQKGLKKKTVLLLFTIR